MILTGSDEENVPLRLRQPQKKYISYLSIHLDCVVRERLKILRIENDRENIVAWPRNVWLVYYIRRTFGFPKYNKKYTLKS